jgi:hypothetical protein
MTPSCLNRFKWQIKISGARSNRVLRLADVCACHASHDRYNSKHNFVAAVAAIVAAADAIAAALVSAATVTLTLHVSHM